MEPLVVIPARGGSKGVPRKNVKKLAGKPLINYTIEIARKIFDDEIICVSTDDREIKKVAEQQGLKVPFLRPKHLASDTTGMREVLQHALEYYEKERYQIDTVILLQPTSPLRRIKHVKEAIELYKQGLDRVVSVKETSANPYYLLYEENEQGYLEKCKKGNFKRRQDCPKVWEVNGAVYVINAESLRRDDYKNKKVVKYEMDELSSIDIDTKLDWAIAEKLLKD
jgi:N-acylneuraminate cytidylyltransferase